MNERKKYEPSMNNYVLNEYSVCREERQYVVFLYNILRKYSKSTSREKDTAETVRKIFEACGLEHDADLDHVFYEASFMRDFFERERRLALSKEEDWKWKLLNKRFTASNKEDNDGLETFNSKLVQYVYEQTCKESEGNKGKIKLDQSKKYTNLGQNELGELKLEETKTGNARLEDSDQARIGDRTKWIMNAQPDIAIVYHTHEKDSRKKLLFIECKYLSKESNYKYSKNDGREKQRYVQGMIAGFLCSYLKVENGEEMELSAGMKKDESRLVRFVRQGKTQKTGENEGEISITHLIETDKGIFYK